MKWILTTAVIATLGVAAGTVDAQSVRWDMANEYGQTSIHGESDQFFSDLVAMKTEGDIQITHHFGASLGYRSQDQIDAVADGALPLANTFTGPLAGLHWVFQTSGLPFLTRDFDEARVLFEAALPRYLSVLEENNQTLLWATPWPPAGIWANRSVANLDELQGLRIRTYDQLGTVTLREAGASPIQLSWADVAPQLSTGALDAVLTSIEAGLSGNLQELQSHFMPILFGTPLNIATINNDVLAELTDAQRAAVLEAAAEVQERQWSIIVERVANNAVRAVELGVTVVSDLDAAMMERLRASAAPAIEIWLERSGDEGASILAEFRKETGQ